MNIYTEFIALVVLAVLTFIYFLCKLTVYDNFNAKRSNEIENNQCDLVSEKKKQVNDLEKHSSPLSEIDYVYIFYGSQTGSALKFAKSMKRNFFRSGVKCRIQDPIEFDIEELCQLSRNPPFLAIFIVATYGDGEPTMNFVTFWDYISSCQDRSLFNNLSYTVFGLGDRTYPAFNFIGRNLDKKLSELSACRFHNFVAGDSGSGNMESIFIKWSDQVVKKMCRSFPQIIIEDIFQEYSREYEINVIENYDEEKIFHGEPYFLHSYKKQKKPFNAKNPLLAPIKSMCFLGKYTESESSCMKIVFDIGTNIKYEPGDHVVIYPQNDPTLVDTLLKLLDVDPETIIDMKPLDVQGERPFPCPCSIHTAFTHYLDINHFVSRDFISEIIPYTVMKDDREFLRKLVDPSDKNHYQNWIIKGGRNVVYLLEDVPMVRPPVDVVIELLPRLNPRYYSISSSLQASPGEVHITVGLNQWKSSGARVSNGVCSHYLRNKKPGDHVPIFVKTSKHFRLPPRSITPVIMIASGTGIAPFIGFLQHRLIHRMNQEQDRGHGNMILFYGCRSKENSYWYSEDLKIFESKNVLTQNFVISSKDSPQKSFVVDLIKTHGSIIWLNIINSAVLYICGGKENFANEVLSALFDIIHDVGGMDVASADNYLSKMKQDKRIVFDVWMER